MELTGGSAAVVTNVLRTEFGITLSLGLHGAAARKAHFRCSCLFVYAKSIHAEFLLGRSSRAFAARAHWTTDSPHCSSMPAILPDWRVIFRFD